MSASRSPSALRPPVGKHEGVDRASVAVPRAVRAAARARLLRRVGSVSAQTLSAVEGALNLILGLD
ncbi:MAG: hypothetical protein ACLP8S_02630 [Solirubrobacteraceae bacterium]